MPNEPTNDKDQWEGDFHTVPRKHSWRDLIIAAVIALIVSAVVSAINAWIME